MSVLDRFGYIGLVARREVKERLRGRTFRVVTVLLMAVIGAAVVIPALNQNSKTKETIGVVGTLSPGIKAELLATTHTLGDTLKFVTESDSSAADEDLRSGHIDLAIDGTRLTTKKTVSSSGTSDSDIFARVAASALGTTKSFQEAGLSPAQAAILSTTQPVPIRSLESSGPSSTTTGTTVIGVVLTFILLTQYMTWTLMGVMEEKASRVVEVLLAAVRPIQLLAGKIIGIGVLALGQAGLLVAEALILSKTVGADLLKGAGTATIVASLVELVLGYAFYCWVYAAAGSMVERQDQVQSMALPLAAPMIFGYITSITAASSGHASGLFHVLAFLPPTAPFAVPVMVGLNQISWVGFAISAAISVVSTLVVSRLAARIYRRAVLRTGRAVRWSEALQILRTG